MKIWEFIRLHFVLFFASLLSGADKSFAAVKPSPHDPELLKLTPDGISETLFNLATAASVPQDVMRQLIQYWRSNLATHQMRYWFVVDFNESSAKKRLIVFDIVNRTFTRHLVAHGHNSEGRWGMAEHFSNVNGSHMSSLGIYRIAETYTGKHGLSCKMDGLSPTNSNVRSRVMVLHSALYVSEAYALAQGRCGRSDGCFAVSVGDIHGLIDKLKGGSLGIAFHG